jgi:thiamine kinase-like enzyme
LALHQADISIAPIPVLIDHDSYTYPVVVQTWLNGEVLTTPPASDAEWESLLQHFAIIHTFTPDKTDVKLPEAILNASSVKDGIRMVQQQVAYIPRKALPASLQALIRRFEALHFPDWPDAPATLCRVDPNSLNFIRRPGLWASVDWENSGWGDPAFEIAGLMTHPAYMSVPSSRWDWVVDTYCNLVNHTAAATRIQVYYKFMLVWWVARLARYLYEIPQGLDKRLVGRPADWQADMSIKYESYLGMAEALL